jgi:hypothetical protein
MKRYFFFALLFIVLYAPAATAQCGADSVGPRGIDFLSYRYNHEIYYGITDGLFIDNRFCLKRSQVKKITAKAISNCDVNCFSYLGAIDNTVIQIKAEHPGRCMIEITVNDTLTRTLEYLTTVIPLPKISLNEDYSSFELLNNFLESLRRDPSTDMYWTIQKFKACIIDNGKMIYSGENTGDKNNPALIAALKKASKNSIVLLYDVTVETMPGIVFRKETYVFDAMTYRKQ